MRSRRQSRQTGPVYLATGSLSLTDVLSPRLRGLQLGKTLDGPGTPGVLKLARRSRGASLDAAALARPAAVVRDGGHVLDGLDLDARGLERADRRLAAGAGPLDHHVHGTDSCVLGAVAGVLRRHLGREGRALPRALETDPPGRRPGEDVALRIGDRDDRVVEGRLDVRDAVRHHALFLPLGALAILLSFRFGHLDPLVTLLLGRLLLARHGAAARPLPGPRIGLGPLSTGRQALPVAHPAIAPDLHQALDVLADLFPEIALDAALVLNDLADPPRLVLGQIADLRDVGHLGLDQNVARARPADPV